MRLVGIDFGGTRIGVAVTDTKPGIPSARPHLKASGKLSTDAAAIAQIVRKEEADAVVLGLPLDKGEETKMSKICRKLGAEIEARGVVLFVVDEALTSVEAESDLSGMGLKASQVRKQVDGEAAVRILLRHLEAHENGS
jgi:putative Holliday junction resolvase